MATYEQVTGNLDVALARKIIEAAIANGAYEGAVPTDDTQALSDGKELCEVANTAFNQGVKSDAVTGILEAAGIDAGPSGGEQPPAPPQAAAPAVPDVYPGQVRLVDPNDGSVKVFDESAAIALKGAGWNEYQPPAPPAPEPPATPAPPAPVQEQAADGKLEIDSIIPGYDDLKVKEIKPKLAELATQEQFDAVKAYEEKNEGRKGILEYEWTPPAPPAAPPAPTSTASADDYGDTAALKTAYHSGQLGHEVANREQLGTPANVEGDEPFIPIDLSSLGDGQLSDLHTRFHQRDVRASYLIGIEESREMAAKQIASDEYGDAFERFLEEEKGNLGDKVTASALDSARSNANRRAENAGEVVQWRNRGVRHAIEARGLKARQVGYEKSVNRLSREQSRREAERSGSGR